MKWLECGFLATFPRFNGFDNPDHSLRDDFMGSERTPPGHFAVALRRHLPAREPRIVGRRVFAASAGRVSRSEDVLHRERPRLQSRQIQRGCEIAPGHYVTGAGHEIRMRRRQFRRVEQNRVVGVRNGLRRRLRPVLDAPCDAVKRWGFNL